MHLTRVVIIEDSKILATRAHDSARSYNSCACLKYIGSGACQLVQSILLPLTSQRSLLCPRTKEFETLRGFNAIFMQTCLPLFLLFGAQKWPPHHVSELFKSVMEIAWRLWCPVLPAYSENSESFKQKSNAGPFRFPPVKCSLRDSKDAQDKSESPNQCHWNLILFHSGQSLQTSNTAFRIELK